MWKGVAEVRISAVQCYTSAICGRIVKESNPVYRPPFPEAFFFACANNDCTGHGFDLWLRVADAVANGGFCSGSVDCDGHEAWRHSNRCPCRLDYEIRVTYSSNQDLSSRQKV